MSLLRTTPWVRRDLSVADRVECRSLADDLTVSLVGGHGGFRCRILRANILIADSNPDAGEPRYYATAVGAFRAARDILEWRQGWVPV
jgi:hypothetical protein